MFKSQMTALEIRLNKSWMRAHIGEDALDQQIRRVVVSLLVRYTSHTAALVRCEEQCETVYEHVHVGCIVAVHDRAPARLCKVGVRHSVGLLKIPFEREQNHT